MINLKNKFVFTITGVFVALMIFTSCAPRYRMTKCPSYVVCYEGPGIIYVAAEPTNPQCIIIRAGIGNSYCGLHSEGADKDRYNQLCQKHNDLSYNQYRLIGEFLDEESVTYLDCDFSEITVTADKDFDTTHPVGANLSDVVRFMSWSPYRYITSGYSKFYHYDKADVSEAFDTLMRLCINKKYFDNATEATCYPIDKLVKDLTSDDLILLGLDSPFFLGLLYFEKTPDMKGEYNIVVTIKTDDDRVFSDAVKLTF